LCVLRLQALWENNYNRSRAQPKQNQNEIIWTAEVRRQMLLSLNPIKVIMKRRWGVRRRRNERRGAKVRILSLIKLGDSE
jgi:hypothetical protein